MSNAPQLLETPFTKTWSSSHPMHFQSECFWWVLFQVFLSCMMIFPSSSQSFFFKKKKYNSPLLKQKVNWFANCNKANLDIFQLIIQIPKSASCPVIKSLFFCKKQNWWNAPGQNVLTSVTGNVLTTPDALIAMSNVCQFPGLCF